MRTSALLALAVSMAAAQEPVKKEAVVVTGVYEPVAIEESDRAVYRQEVRGDQALVSNSLTDFLNRDSSIDLRQRGGQNIQTDA